MRISVALVALLFFTATGHAIAAEPADPLCKPLELFVASIGPDQSHELAFHTSWGTNFKNSPEPVIFAKQCSHHGYAPAEAACRALMEHGAVEFSALNAQRAIVCLAPDTRFGRRVDLQRGAFFLRHGTDERGSHVTVEYAEDQEMGGMVLRVVAEGY